MSGAFVKFNGLKTHKTHRRDDSPSYLGSPCLYHQHSGTQGTASTLRDSLTHACLECSQSIANGKFGLDVTRLSAKHQSRALNFWSKVDIGHWDECWRWTAQPINNQLYHVWNRSDLRNLYRHHPILVLMWVTWGDVGRLGTTSLCGERRCCNPLHNIPVDLISSIKIENYSQSWLDSERDLLLSQIDQYNHDKASKSNSKVSAINQKLFGHVQPGDNPLITTPYEAALLSMQESLLSGTHSMLLDD